MARAPPIQLRLITDLDNVLDHHYSLCHYFHDSGDCECGRTLKAKDIPRPESQASDSSFYTAQTSDSTSSRNSVKTVRARISTVPLRVGPSLRHKTSPPEVSLRELRAKQSKQSLVRAKRSEEQLQQAYERQILAYLDGPLAAVDRIKD